MQYIHFLIDFILHIDVHLADLVANYGNWVYAILFVIIFCETGLVITPFLPGDSMLFVAGALSGASGSTLNAHLLVVLMILAALVGDTVNFTIGRLLGKTLFSKGKSRIFKPEYLDQTHAFFERYGGKAIILSRFVPIIRTFAPFVAGMGDMKFGKFLRYNVIGGIAWVAVFVYAGYFFGNLPVVHRNLNYLIIAVIVISLVPPFFEFFRQRLSARKK